VVALAVELTGACQLKPSLEVFGNRLVEQSSLGVAWIAELGFGCYGYLGRAGRPATCRGM
jgi:hypothetical protein